MKLIAQLRALSNALLQVCIQGGVINHIKAFCSTYLIKDQRKLLTEIQPLAAHGGRTWDHNNIVQVVSWIL